MIDAAGIAIGIQLVFPSWARFHEDIAGTNWAGK